MPEDEQVIPAPGGQAMAQGADRTTSADAQDEALDEEANEVPPPHERAAAGDASVFVESGRGERQARTPGDVEAAAEHVERLARHRVPATDALGASTARGEDPYEDREPDQDQEPAPASSAQLSPDPTSADPTSPGPGPAPIEPPPPPPPPTPLPPPTPGPLPGPLPEPDPLPGPGPGQPIPQAEREPVEASKPRSPRGRSR